MVKMQRGKKTHETKQNSERCESTQFEFYYVEEFLMRLILLKLMLFIGFAKARLDIVKQTIEIHNHNKDRTKTTTANL